MLCSISSSVLCCSAFSDSSSTVLEAILSYGKISLWAWQGVAKGKWVGHKVWCTTIGIIFVRVFWNWPTGGEMEGGESVVSYKLHKF